MRTIKLTIAATETHCQGCQYNEGRHCKVFGVRVFEDWDTATNTWQRLPECIAAEKEAGK